MNDDTCRGSATRLPLIVFHSRFPKTSGEIRARGFLFVPIASSETTEQERNEMEKNKEARRTAHAGNPYVRFGSETESAVTSRCGFLLFKKPCGGIFNEVWMKHAAIIAMVAYSSLLARADDSKEEQRDLFQVLEERSRTYYYEKLSTTWTNLPPLGDAYNVEEKALRLQERYATAMTGEALNRKVVLARSDAKLYSLSCRIGSIEYLFETWHVSRVQKPIFLAVRGYSPQVDENFNAAVEFVQEQCLDGTSSHELHAIKGTISQDTVIQGLFLGKKFQNPFDRAWFFFVDDCPGSNWSHPCRCIFVKSDMSEYAIFYSNEPCVITKGGVIVELESCTQANRTTYLGDPFDEARNVLCANSEESASSAIDFSKGDPRHSYALLISGGGNPSSNFSRYWGDVAMVYSTLRKKYGIPKGNITVCLSSGLNSDLDMNVSGAKENSPHDLDGDSESDINSGATKTEIKQAFSVLSQKLTAEDQLFVFITDHGSQGDDGTCYIVPWLGSVAFTSYTQVISPTEFASYVKSIKAPIAFALETCYSGGFIEDLVKQECRVISTACAADEGSSAFAYAPCEGASSGRREVAAFDYCNPWAWAFNAALRGCDSEWSWSPWHDSFVGRVGNADMNGDNMISIYEATQKAKQYVDNAYITVDGARWSFCDRPQYGESENGFGSSFFILKQTNTGLFNISSTFSHLASTANSGSFAVTASSFWTVTRSASATWITLNTTKGSGNGTVSYSVEANTTGSERRGIITVTCGSETATHEVIQSAEAAKLRVNPTSSDVSNASDSNTFSVEANYSWAVLTTASWIHLNETGGNGNGTVSYSIDENTGAQRTGTITITSGSLTATHTVTQAAQPQLSIDPEAKTFSAAAGNGTITVTSDSMWTVSKSSTWIVLDGATSGTGNGIVSYKVLENTGSQRQGWIYVSCGSVKRSLLVTQNRPDSVTFSAESANVPEDGGTGSFTVTILGNNRVISPSASTVPWASWTWATESLSEGTRYTFTYTVQPNTSIQTRSTTILIDFNGTIYKFTITQSPHVNNYLITYRPGANGSGSEAYDVKQKNVSLTLRGEIFTRTDGYTQKGWATIDGGAKIYDLGASYTKNDSITLYPYWEKISSVTTYDVYLSPGTYGDGSVQTMKKYKGTALTLPGATFSREGYEQTGWSTRRVGDTKAYELGGKYMTDASTYLYPYWAKVAQKESNIGFYTPAGWENSMYLSTTNTAWWTYMPQFVFASTDSLRLNYCIMNWDENNAVESVDRGLVLTEYDGGELTSLLESFGYAIPAYDRLHYRSDHVGNWPSLCAPGNFRIQVEIDPANKLNDRNSADNTASVWFAVKADGITLNEALDCSSLYFTDNGTTAFPQTSESVVGGSCVQLGPQPTNSWNSTLWVYLTEPGTLKFKWKATSQNYKAYLGCYADSDLKAYKWATEQTEWEDASVTIDSAPQWVHLQLVSYEPNPCYLTAGWVDCVTWSGDAKKPTFTVDGEGTLTGIQLNGTTDLEIPSMVNSVAVRSIDAYVLTNSPITSLSIPNTVTNIGHFAFYDNRSLAGVTIPGCVVSIGESAFNACSNLKTVVLNEGVRSIGNYAFYNCGNLTVVGLPASLTNIGQSPLGNCCNLHTISVASGNMRYCVENNALIDIATKTLVQYPSGRAESEYEVPNGLLAVGYDAFDQIAALKKVVIPASVTTLDRFAFFGNSNLETVRFKGNAPIVGYCAFYKVASSCKALVSPQSTGWCTNIPGTWSPAEYCEIGIEYSAALQTYAVTYKPGAYGAGAQQSETKQYGIALPLKGAIFTRTGYAQTGWATSDGGAKAYELGASYTANAAVTLYPYWTANTYAVTYDLDGGTASGSLQTGATYDEAFFVPPPTKDGYIFSGWAVLIGLDITTAKYGQFSYEQTTMIENPEQQCFAGFVGLWFINLSSTPCGAVTLSATWEPEADDSRDIGFYAPESYGWTSPVCLSSTNIEYLAYAPETEFVQGMGIYLSFCAVNWSTVGPAMLQSTLLTITDESGAIFDQGEPIQRKTLGAFGFNEVARNMSMRRYISGITPGRYKLTLELDPNRLLNDPDRSNNTTSIWFTVTAPSDPIPELPSDATAADVRVALAGSADERLVEYLTDISAYSAYREWAQTVRRSDGATAAGKQMVKSSDKTWFSFAVDSPKLVEREIVKDDIKVEDFAMSLSGGQFDFTVGITGVEIGNAAKTEYLKTVFGIEGASRLSDNAFSPDNLTLEAVKPEDGKVKITVKLPSPKTGEGTDCAAAFFMRAKVKVK